MRFLAKLSIVTIIASAVACSGSVENEEAQAVEISAENVVVADYEVEGMVCAMGCAKTIQDEVGAMTGVTVSNVDFESGKAHFEYDKTQISEADLKAKIGSIADGQYKVGEWTEEEMIETGDDNEGTEEIVGNVEVALPSFEMPNLFTYLFQNL